MKTKNKSILTAQVIRDDFSRFLSFMPNPDDVAIGTAAAYQTYREMRADPRIKSLLNKLKTAALNFPIRIVQDDLVRDEVFDFVRSQPIFARKLYQKAKRMLAALDYGFSVTEAVWKEENGAFLLDNLITRKPDRFEFDHDWNCFWTHAGERRPLDDPFKWLFFHHNPDDENPYGTSDLRCVYWPWMFKKAGYEFWLMATEKFSVKTILALFEMSGNPEEIKTRAQDIADLLQSVASGSGTALANIKDIKEIGLDGHIAEFQSLVDACDVQIAYGLTGQSVATNNPEKGTQALGTVASDLLRDDAKGIALELQGVLQKAVDWTVELYFGPNEKAPTLEFDIDRKASFEEVMDAVDREIPVSKTDLYAYYKLPEPKDAEDAFVKPARPAGEGFGLSDGEGKKKARRPVAILSGMK